MYCNECNQCHVAVKICFIQWKFDIVFKIFIVMWVTGLEYCWVYWHLIQTDVNVACSITLSTVCIQAKQEVVPCYCFRIFGRLFIKSLLSRCPAASNGWAVENVFCLDEAPASHITRVEGLIRCCSWWCPETCTINMMMMMMSLTPDDPEWCHTTDVLCAVFGVSHL